MRIALVSQEYPPETAKGGIGTQTYAKAQGLAALGHDVHVISRTHVSVRQKVQDGPVQVLRIPSVSSRMDIYTEEADWLTYSSEVAVAIADLHAHAPLDIIDFPEWGAEGYVHLLNRTAWNYIPTVIHLHGPLVMFAQTMGWPALTSEFYRVGTHMEGTCLRLADAVFSSSACSANWCANHYGLHRANIPVIHTGVDTKLFHPHEEVKENQPTIVFAGKIVRNKGVFVLLEAACRLAPEYPDLQLWMLGRGEDHVIAELREYAVAQGFPHLLRLPGFVSRPEMPCQLSRAHVFAAPSQYEGGPGFVYLEAMACGLPVIACEGSGASEVVFPEENGLLVPPEDVAQLVVALRRLLSDSDTCARMGQGARNFVLEHADQQACLREILAFYASVVENRAGAPTEVLRT